MPDTQTRGRHLRLFALLVGVVYFVFAPGNLSSVDAVPSIETAEALLSHGELAIAGRLPLPGFYYQDPGGRTYSRMGIGMPLLYLVPVALGRGLARLTGDPEPLTVAFGVSFVSPLLGWLTVCAIFYAFLRLGQPPLAAWFGGLSLALATVFLPFARASTRDVGMACALSLAAVAWQLEGQQLLPRRLRLVAPIAVALGLLIKQVFLVPIAPFLIYYSWQHWRQRTWRQMLPGALIIGATGILILVYQTEVFGGPTHTGYSRGVMHFDPHIWSTPLLGGIYEQLFSESHGLFMISPSTLFFATLVVVAGIRGRLRGGGLAAVLAMSLQLLFYAPWQSPVGFSPYEPRYLLVGLPLLFLVGVPLYDWQQSFFRHANVRRLIYAGTVAFSIQQCCFVLVNTQMAPQIVGAAVASGGGTAAALPRVTWEILLHKLATSDETYCLKDFVANAKGGIGFNQTRSFVGFNLWWLHFLRYRSDPSPKTATYERGSDHIRQVCGDT